MYYLFADETNTTPKSDKGVKFFVYGGLIVPADKISLIDNEIRQLRHEAGYLKTDSLKFSANSRPKTLSDEEFAVIKQKLIGLCIKHECKLLLYVVHHEIAKSTGINKTIKWGADHIISKFHNFLETKQADGIVIIDRLSNTAEYQLLIEKFTIGLTYPDKVVSLDRIKLFASSCDNASHLSSLSDVLLGAFRYCINNPATSQASKTMMQNLVMLIWSVKNGSDIDPFERGLTFRPLPDTVTIPKYKKDYDQLVEHLNALL